MEVQTVAVHEGASAPPEGKRRALDPRLRASLWLLVFALLTGATVLVAYPRMFTGIAAYDDEGYMLVALKSFVNHGHLYDEVFTQYGPFYYEAWGGLFSLFGIPIDLDSGRMATM